MPTDSSADTTPSPRFPGFVDTHVHLWNVEENPWYPEMMDRSYRHQDAEIHNIEDLRSNYLLDDYLADIRRHGVAKLIHVSATQGAGAYLAETRWLKAIAARTGMPHAMIGQLEPRAELNDIARDLAVQLDEPLFRGVRITFHIDPTSAKAADIFALVADAGCLLEIVAQPHNAPDFARLLDRFPDMTTIVEHAGWPTRRNDPAHFAQWRAGMTQLAQRSSTLCKISGLPMALRSHDTATLRPWVEGCIELFGDERCMFGGNFPVDRLFGSFDGIFGAYRAIVDPLGEIARQRLFAGNAERIYRV